MSINYTYKVKTIMDEDAKKSYYENKCRVKFLYKNHSWCKNTITTSLVSHSVSLLYRSMSTNSLCFKSRLFVFFRQPSDENLIYMYLLGFLSPL
jgi:hypothetical protein